LNLASRACGGLFDYDQRLLRLEEVRRELEDPDVWRDAERATALNRERAELETLTGRFARVEAARRDARDLLELLEAEDDPALLVEAADDIGRLTTDVEGLEFERMFSGPLDRNNAFLEINAGAGGTEAQDWVTMLLRMYLRFCDGRGFRTEIIDESPGEVAGLRSVTVHVEGDHAYGWLRTETGIHRLVRKSPFDSGNRRHTSFASVDVTPEIDDSIAIEINPADLRVDTFRASGAGGQHVNRTESAVRITHVPTGIVVACQSERSQHKNRDTAMKQLRAKLYEREQARRNADLQAREAAKPDISWGHQIRSYVLDQSRIKDLRTGVETMNTQAVLEGAIAPFLTAALKAQESSA
jgi:peptide chain release factor 2